MDKMKTNILGVDIDVVTRSEALAILLGFLDGETNHILFTPNPEFVLEARKDHEFMDILNKGDLVVPDGVGIVLASRITGEKIKERVAGCDLILSLFDEIKDKERTIYFFGGKPGVAEKAKANMEEKYPGLIIIGCSDGYYDKKKERLIIREIQSLKPDILLVFNSFPKQEKWIYEHKKRLPVKLTAGLGGSIDVMAKTVKRAPAFMRKIGLEWFWRLLLQPSRIKRMYKLPLFFFRVILERFSN